MTNMKCECVETGKPPSYILYMYDEETELPFVNHEPGKCRCTNELKLYRCSDGVERILCSCCNKSNDTFIR